MLTPAVSSFARSSLPASSDPVTEIKRDVSAERDEVHGAVRRAAGQCFGLFVLQDKYWGFTRDSANRTVHEFVGDCVADDRDLLSREAPDYVEQACLELARLKN